MVNNNNNFGKIIENLRKGEDVSFVDNKDFITK